MRLGEKGDVGFRGFRKFGATMIQWMDLPNSLALAQRYLAHSPATIAERHYIESNEAFLDAALLKLEKIVDLKL